MAYRRLRQQRYADDLEDLSGFSNEELFLEFLQQQSTGDEKLDALVRSVAKRAVERGSSDADDDRPSTPRIVHNTKRKGLSRRKKKKKK